MANKSESVERSDLQEDHSGTEEPNVALSLVQRIERYSNFKVR
jgi:hypothetical protein